MQARVLFPLSICFFVTTFSYSCEAKISATDPDAVRTHNETADARRKPWVFPSPDIPPGETNPPGGRPLVLPTRTATPPAPDSSAGATPAPEATVLPVGTPSTARILEVIPPEAKVYRIGDEVSATVTYDKPVIWIGNPLLEFKESIKTFAFEPILGLGGTSHVFRYEVKPGDEASALLLATGFNLADGTMQERNGGEVVNTFPDAATQTPIAGVVFDGKQDKAVSVTLPNNGSYSDSFDILVEFPGNVTLRGVPYLDIFVDTNPPTPTATPKRALALKAEGKVVTFRYHVEQDDNDLVDGVTFSRVLKPGSQNMAFDAILGTNGNPVFDSLADAAWAGGTVIKVGKEQPSASLMAHFRVEQGRLFAAPDTLTAGCNSATALAWTASTPTGCWQEASGRQPYLVSEGPTPTSSDKRPLLVAPVMAPFSRAALTFASPGAQPDGERVLRFPAQGAPAIAPGSPRFVAMALLVNTTAPDVPLFSLDSSRGVFLSPADNLVRFSSDAKSGTAEATLPVGGTVVLGLWDSGTQTTVVQWSAGGAQRRSVNVVPSGGNESLFSWSFDGLKVGGRLASGSTAFEGAIAELLFYGSLTEAEQARVLCTLAKNHLAHAGSCLD